MNALKVFPTDNVAVALKPISEGEEIQVKGMPPLLARGGVPLGHKIALTFISKGDPVVKYGEHILVASEDIAPGQWVHSHNTRLAGF